MHFTVWFLCIMIFDHSSGLIYSGCAWRCNKPFDNSKLCQCNSACRTHKDCCHDYQSLCEPTESTPHHTTTTSLPAHTGSLADRLWQVDPDKVPISDIHLNIGGHTHSGSTNDVSPNKLFSHVNTAYLNKPIYQALMALWDNYIPSRGVTDPVTTANKAEINHFLDLVMASPVMDETYTYLTSKHIFVGSKSSFRQKLYSLWFEPFSRSGGRYRDNCGFEHVFVGEYKSSSVEGFHNWLRFYKEEQTGNVNYLGYIKRVGPRLLEITFDWNNHHKNVGSFILGSSPVYDMAIDTVCILSKPNSKCPYTLDGHTFSIKQYDDLHTSGLQVATAFVML